MIIFTKRFKPPLYSKETSWYWLMCMNNYAFGFLPGIFAVLVTTDHLDNLSLGQKGTILTYISSVIYLNCIANPLIYACKIKKVSRFLRKLFKVREHVTYVTEYDLKPESGEQLIEKEVHSITNRWIIFFVGKYSRGKSFIGTNLNASHLIEVFLVWTTSDTSFNSVKMKNFNKRE